MRISRYRATQAGSATTFVAAVVAAGLLLTGLMSPVPAAADPRSDAESDRDRSQSAVDNLTVELDGIDADLAELYAAMEQTKLDLAIAQEQLASAEAELAAAESAYQLLVDQLADAQALKQQLDQEIEDSRKAEGQLTQAVGNMAREMYRGESVSPLEVVIKSGDFGEITDRAAAATALSRAQSIALDEVRTRIVSSENQVDKQAAVTSRIADLEAQAEVAYQAAEVARQQVADGLATLEGKQQDQQAAQASWEARRTDASAELDEADAELADALARIVAIDKKEAEEQAAREEAARQEQAAAQNSGAQGTGAIATGKLFANPFRISARLTSPFGYRIHPILGTRILHEGTDLAAECGTPLYGVRAGTVIMSGYNDVSGNFIRINHGIINGQSYITHYSHMSQILVSPGQSVDTSTTVGLTGTTGRSTGCHLHLTLFLDGTPVDIMPYASF